MNENVSDVDLERFLRRRDRISREYQALGSEQPAPALDARVLEEARAALAHDASASGWRRRRWPTMLALAATVLLSFTLILRIALETDQPVPVPSSTPMPEAQLPRNSVGQEAAADQPAAAPSEAASPLPRAQIEAEIRAAAERSTLADPPSAAVETRANSRARAEAKRSDASAPPPPQAGLMKKEESMRTERAFEAASPEFAEPPQAPRPEADAKLDNASQTTAARARAPLARQRVMAGTADKADRVREPEAWLEEIERLRAAGRFEEANLEMQRFVETYPRYLQEHPRPPTQ